MLGLGIWEILIILVTALVVLGPEKLPQVARQLARLLGELRRVSDDVRRNFDDVMAEPVDANRPDAPRAVPLGVMAAHSGATAPMAPDDQAQQAMPKAPHDGAEAARVSAALSESAAASPAPERH